MPDHLHGMRRADRMVLVFIGFDQQRKQVETIGFGRILLRLVGEVLLDFHESRLVFGFGADGTIDHRTVSGSIRSYSAWVPTNFTNTRLNRYAMCTTSRYLFPAMSKMTRFPPWEQERPVSRLGAYAERLSSTFGSITFFGGKRSELTLSTTRRRYPTGLKRLSLGRKLRLGNVIATGTRGLARAGSGRWCSTVAAAARNRTAQQVGPT